MLQRDYLTVLYQVFCILAKGDVWGSRGPAQQVGGV